MTENRWVNPMRELLLAGDDERRAIERALHDGVQQQLVAVAVNLQIARGLVAADPEAAARLIDDIQAVVGAALDEVRDLAQRVHPPLLETQGLVAALRMAAAAAPIPTRVEGAVEGPVPAEVAMTVYRCCVATLAAAEGEGGRATIAVQARDGTLEFEVALSKARIRSNVLDPSARRATAFGGALEATPTRVTGRLPLTS
jgi:signal transduction histidine kinase